MMEKSNEVENVQVLKTQLANDFIGILTTVLRGGTM